MSHLLFLEEQENNKMEKILKRYVLRLKDFPTLFLQRKGTPGNWEYAYTNDITKALKVTSLSLAKDIKQLFYVDTNFTKEEIDFAIVPLTIKYSLEENNLGD